ncbi:MAG: hypothetical protein ACI95C_000756 [Pseudohongiellaceae bacterium]|jgi:hypothetical protein
MIDPDLEDPEVLKQKLNLDTARINWSLLANYQKEGAVIEVMTSLDLVEVATEFALDNTEKVKTWLTANLIQMVNDEQASLWLQQNREIWSVVVAPWVLVQTDGLPVPE